MRLELPRSHHVVLRAVHHQALAQRTGRILEDASFEKAAQISADVIVGDEVQERPRIFDPDDQTPLKPSSGRIESTAIQIHPREDARRLECLACRSGVGQWQTDPL